MAVISSKPGHCIRQLVRIHRAVVLLCQLPLYLTYNSYSASNTLDLPARTSWHVL
jgi:hypothetical protein